MHASNYIAACKTTAVALYSTFVIDVGITAEFTNPQFE